MIERDGDRHAATCRHANLRETDEPLRRFVAFVIAGLDPASAFSLVVADISGDCRPDAILLERARVTTSDGTGFVLRLRVLATTDTGADPGGVLEQVAAHLEGLGERIHAVDRDQLRETFLLKNRHDGRIDTFAATVGGNPGCERKHDLQR